MNIELYSSKLNKALGKKEVLEANQQRYVDLITVNTKRLILIEKAQVLIQKVAQETQELLRYQINDVVNTCINTVFPDVYNFKIEFEVKRNKTEAKLIFTKNGHEVNPMEASGGGVVDMAALGLRIAAWSISNFSDTIVIDEGFKFVSRDLQDRAATIMEEISKKLGIQIIQVSHSPDMIAHSDKVFQVTMTKGVSSVSVLDQEA